MTGPGALIDLDDLAATDFDGAVLDAPPLAVDDARGAKRDDLLLRAHRDREYGKAQARESGNTHDPNERTRHE